MTERRTSFELKKTSKATEGSKFLRRLREVVSHFLFEKDEYFSKFPILRLVRLNSVPALLPSLTSFPASTTPKLRR